MPRNKSNKKMIIKKNSDHFIWSEQQKNNSNKKPKKQVITAQKQYHDQLQNEMDLQLLTQILQSSQDFYPVSMSSINVSKNYLITYLLCFGFIQSAFAQPIAKVTSAAFEKVLLEYDFKSTQAQKLYEQAPFVAIQNRDLPTLINFLNKNDVDISMVVAGIMQENEEITELLLKNYKDINGFDIMKFEGHNQIVSPWESKRTSFMHICAENNKLISAKILLKYGARPDSKLYLRNYDRISTPLSVALINEHYEFAWMLVDEYQQHGIPMLEEEAFGIMDILLESSKHALAGNLSNAANLLFFPPFTKLKLNTQRLSGAVSISAIIILCACVFQNRKRRSKIQFMTNLLRRSNIDIKVSTQLQEFIDKFLNGLERSSPYVDPIFFALLFPLAIALDDGHTYEWNIEQLKDYGNKGSPILRKPISIGKSRLNINLILHIRTVLANAITKDEKLPQEQKNSLLGELATLPFKDKDNNIIEDITSYLRDPYTREIMSRPCIAPNGLSYQVKYEGLEPSFKTKIPGFEKEVTVIRNYALQQLIENLHYKISDQHQQNKQEEPESGNKNTL